MIKKKIVFYNRLKVYQDFATNLVIAYNLYRYTLLVQRTVSSGHIYNILYYRYDYYFHTKRTLYCRLLLNEGVNKRSKVIQLFGRRAVVRALRCPTEQEATISEWVGGVMMWNRGEKTFKFYFFSRSLHISVGQRFAYIAYTK